MLTLKELKDRIGDLPDDTVLRFAGYIEFDRDVGVYDDDCRVTFEVNETEVIVGVTGDRHGPTGGYVRD